MARLIELKQTALERFLARFDTGEELRTTLAVVTDFHLRSGKELTEPELNALRAASERSRCRQRALRIIGARAMSVKELTDRLKEKGESPENAEDAAAQAQHGGFKAQPCSGAGLKKKSRQLFAVSHMRIHLRSGGNSISQIQDCHRFIVIEIGWFNQVSHSHSPFIRYSSRFAPTEINWIS